MAGLIYDLIDLLQSMAVEYEALLELAKSKTKVIVENDIEGVQSITNAESAIVNKLAGMERKRLVAINDIASVLNQKAEDMSVNKLADILEGQPDESAAIREAGERLSMCLKDLKRQNDQNGVLIKESLDYINFSLNAIRSRSEAMPPSYGGVSEQNQRSFFDRKQ